jgi:hypothetical protein
MAITPKDLIKFGDITFTNKTPFEIRDIITEFKNSWATTLIPSYKLAMEMYNKDYTFRSEEAIDYNRAIVSWSNTNSRNSNFAAIIYTLAARFDLEEFCNNFLDRFKEGIEIYTLTIADAYLINRLICLQLFSKYATNLLHYISIMECNSYPDNVSLAGYGYNKQQIAWLEKQSSNFKLAIDYLQNSVKDMYAEVDKMPTTYLIENKRSGFAGGMDVDDLRWLLKSILKIGTLITGVGAVIQTLYWRQSGGTALEIAKDIQRQKQLKDSLELRLIHLRNLQNGTPSASVEKNIQITEDRLRKLDKELNDIEAKYGK